MLCVHLLRFLLAFNAINPRPTRGIRSSKAALSVNPRWTNIILYWLMGDTGTRPWKVKANKQIYHKYTVMIFVYEQIV
jgi:hypothetical protein